MARIKNSLFAKFEITLNEKLMFLSYQWWHQNIHVMALHFKL